MSTDLAYLAGLIDGEGYIGIKRARPRRDRKTPGFHARIQVRMVDEPAIAFLADTLGGRYYRERREGAEWAKGDRRPLYCYQVSDAACERVLRALLPYLRVKRRQADLVLELRRLQADGQQHRTKVIGTRRFPNAAGTVRMVETRAFSDEYVARCSDLADRVSARNRPLA